MPFFTKKDIGRIYVIRIILPNNTAVYKIGMCHSNRSTDRMMEILRSWFNKYRFIPYSKLKLDMATTNVDAIEKHIHKMLKHRQFIPNEDVQGKTEMFTGIDETKVLQFIKHCKDKEVPKILDTEYEKIGKMIL